MRYDNLEPSLPSCLLTDAFVQSPNRGSVRIEDISSLVPERPQTDAKVAQRMIGNALGIRAPANRRGAAQEERITRGMGEEFASYCRSALTQLVASMRKAKAQSVGTCDASSAWDDE